MSMRLERTGFIGSQTWIGHNERFGGPWLAGQACQRDLFGAQNLNLGQDAQDFKQLAVAIVQISQNHFALGFVDGFDSTEQQRNADAVDELGFFEVDNQISDPVLQHFEASPLDPFAPQLIQIRAGVNNSGALDESCPDFDRAHSVTPQTDGLCPMTTGWIQSRAHKTIFIVPRRPGPAGSLSDSPP